MPGRGFALAIVVTAIFVLPIMQFGFLQSSRDNFKGELVNDGRAANFFVLHARPYYVVPEDFHLYVVRGKRVAERGWISDILWGRDAEAAKSDRAAPLQAGLGYLAYLTGGEPLRYTLFLMALVFMSWSALVLIALTELRKTYGYAAVLALSLVVAICEIPTSLVSLIGGYLPAFSAWSADKIWPPYKALRFSTHGWSLPLFVAFVIMAARLALGSSLSRFRTVSLFCILCLFALGDIWSFLLSLGVLGLAWLSRAAQSMRTFFAAKASLTMSARRAICNFDTLVMIGLAAAPIILFAIFSGPSGIDAQLRAGFGSPWTQSQARIGGIADITSGRFVSVLIVYLLLTSAAVYLRPRRTVRTSALIGALPLAAAAVCTVVFWILGVDSWQLNQFHDRAYACVFLGLMLTGWTVLRAGLAFRAANIRTIRRRLVNAASIIPALLAVFFVLHAGRIHIYIQRVATQDYALTRDLESLKQVLQELDRDHQRASLATLSHEINYLAALWTDFDLALPEGFPLHYGGTNKSIAERTATLLDFYNATPQSWKVFNLRQHPHDQMSWMTSRTLSEREGFAYYLFHRLDSSAAFGDTFGSSTALVANAMAAGKKGKPFRPDIVILDETSALVGRPTLDGYVLASRLTSIEVYRRVN